MGVGDVYEIVDVQTLKGQEVLNVYTYRQFSAVVPVDPTPNVAAALAYEFTQTTLFETILNAQSPELEHTIIRVRNLFEASDKYDLVGSWPGNSGAVGGIDTTFAAMGFVETEDNGAVRPGHKRLGGMPDAYANDGVLTGAGPLAQAAIIADELASNIDAGLIIRTPSWEPVVVKRVRSGTPGNYEYRFPANIGELIYGKILEAAFNVLVTSQVSRKIGIGS